MIAIKFRTRTIVLILLIGLLICSSCLLSKWMHVNKNFSKLYSIKPSLNCLPVFNEGASSDLIKEAAKWKPIKNETYIDETLLKQIHQNCHSFLIKQKYLVNLPRNFEEENFRIAFSIMVFKSFSQVERLLRTIYRPWNYYCIHVDTKSSLEFLKAIESLVNCLNGQYNNIISTVNRVDVQWGQMSVLTADLNCMKELYERYKDWKYFINLTGQEFPLKTNAELVKILKAYKGANNLEGTYKRRNEERVPKVKMPFPIVWYKGSVHITVNKAFVNFIFESPKSKVILEALNNSIVPDEQYFSTLNHNTQLMIPGSFVGDPDDLRNQTLPLKDFLTRFKNWGDYSCLSKKIVRGICIWGVGDLPKLVVAPHLFANKFYEDFQPATVHCLEKWYYDKIVTELLIGKVTINTTFYESLPFVKYRFIPANE